MSWSRFQIVASVSIALCVLGCARKKTAGGTTFEWETGGGALMVKGVVVDQYTGSIVNGTEVEIETDSGLVLSSTDGSGKFSFNAGERSILSLRVGADTLSQRINCAEGIRFRVKVSHLRGSASTRGGP